MSEQASHENDDVYVSMDSLSDEQRQTLELHLAIEDITERADKYTVFSDVLPGNSFPPFPARLGALVLSRIERSEDAYKHTVSVYINEKDESQREITAHQLVLGCQRLTEPYHQLRRTMASMGASEVVDNDMTKWKQNLLVKKSGESGLRTLAAVALYASNRTDLRVSGLFVPKKFVEEFPLEHREEWFRRSKETGGFGGSLDERSRAYEREVAQNGPREGVIMATAASVMPDVADVIKFLFQTGVKFEQVNAV